MNRSRSQLHRNKLNNFTVWLKSIGWENHPVKGHYESLRMSHPGHKGFLLIYYSHSSDHHTTFGIGTDLVNKWLRTKRNNP